MRRGQRGTGHGGSDHRAHRRPIAVCADSGGDRPVVCQLRSRNTHAERKEQTETAIRQVGEISYFTNAVLLAVFFALLFVTGNTMTQSARERIPEFAVLQTLGFSSTRVLAIVLAEAVLLCLTAAVIGLAVAAVLFPNLEDFVGLARLSWRVVVIGLSLSALLALISMLLPAWNVRRLRIVEALRVV